MVTKHKQYGDREHFDSFFKSNKRTKQFYDLHHATDDTEHSNSHSNTDLKGARRFQQPRFLSNALDTSTNSQLLPSTLTKSN